MIAFCSVAFGDPRYIEQQNRLIESINKCYPSGVDQCHWTNALPSQAKPFLTSLYGFKVHAVKHLIDQGYKKIVFFDPAMIVLENIDFYFDLCKEHGVVAIMDDTKLPASNSALKHFGYTMEDIKGFHLVGGSMYVFNFPYSQPVFDLWYNAEINGIFGSQEEEATGKLQGHRADESCMALSLYKSGFKPLPYTGSRYNWDQNPVVIKKHFK